MECLAAIFKNFHFAIILTEENRENENESTIIK